LCLNCYREDGKGGKGGKKGGEKKGGKKGGDKKDAAADEHAAVAVEEVAPEETMAAKIEAEIERSQAECAASVSEYYTTKVGDIHGVLLSAQSWVDIYFSWLDRCIYFAVCYDRRTPSAPSRGRIEFQRRQRS
jgi:hypothetical protein